jgi:Methyltransferase domain
MNDQEIDIVLRRYTERLAALGPVPEALGWTKGRHKLRYHLLLQPWNLTTEQLLDFGCGFGDMYDYCREHLPQVSYEGFDLNPALVAAGRQRYPDAHLSAGVALRDGLHGQWDVIVASGLFNFLLTDNWSFIEAMFDLFARHARIGFAANFLSDRVDYRLDHTYHADPVKVLDLAYRYSNRVMLRNDYMPFEFTLYVDFRRDFDKTHVVYPEFMPYVDVDD